MTREIRPDASQLREIQLTELEMLGELNRICRKNDIPYVIIAGTMLGAVRHGGFIPWDDDVDVAMLREDYLRFRTACGKDLDSLRFEFQDAEVTPGYRWGYGKLRRKDTLFLRQGQEDMPYFQGMFLDLFPLDPCPEGRMQRALWNFRCFLVRKRLWARTGKHVSKSASARAVYAAMDRIPEERILSGLDALIKKSRRYEGSRWVRILMFPTPNRQYTYLKKWYEQSRGISFEGQIFPGPADADGYLSFKFGDYMTLPPESGRKVHPVSALRLLSEPVSEAAAAFLRRIGTEKIYVFGTGYVAGVLAAAMKSLGRAERIEAFVETSPAKKEYRGRPVISLEEYSALREKKSLYLAVHDSVYGELSGMFEDRGIEHESVYPYLFDLLYGAPERTEDVALREILKAQDRRHHWIAVRYAALESMDGDFPDGKDAYVRCMRLFSGQRTAEKRLARFEDLYTDIRENGYDISRPVLLDEDLRVIDGLHRIAIAARLGAESLPCRIYRRSSLYDQVLGDSNYITEEKLAEAGLSKAASERIKEIRALLARE